VKAGVHLPQIDVVGEGLSSDRLLRVVRRARDSGFVAVSANDHFGFARPWLDGLVALSMVAPQAGTMDLVTSVALPSLRGPLPLASALAGLHHLAAGGVVAGVGPGSSRIDQDLAGLGFEDRWGRFDLAVRELRRWLQGESSLSRTQLGGGPDTDIPVWVASWGSAAGLRRVARLGDGWVASAYNTAPAGVSAGLSAIAEERARLDLSPVEIPAMVTTMWTWVTESAAEAERILSEVVAPMVGRSPEHLRGRVCVGSAQQCADLLSRYGEAGCGRVHFWPVGEEERQLDLLAATVLPQVGE
jgi:alkanesulfonate monooxygenase SsuD/methylene tetrahydromethanopterin reductase-like flavin-dependent oxidoreductase (luciferase family)